MASDMQDRIDEQDGLIAALSKKFADIESQNAAQTSEVKAERAEIARQVQEYAYEVASRRGYEKVAGLILAVFAALSIFFSGLFAFLDFKELERLGTKVTQFDNNANMIVTSLDRDIKNFKSGLDDNIDDKIALFFDRNKMKINVYESNVKYMKELISSLNKAEKKWKEIEPAIIGLASYDKDADIKGDYLALLDSGEPSLDYDDLDVGARAKRVGVVIRVTEHLKKAEDDPNFLSQFTPTDVFNVAQIARILNRPDLEKQLVTAAYRLEDTDSTRALYLQQQVRFGNADERDKAFAELMDLVTKLTMDSPEIVIAEAWNAAEDRRRYTDFIAAIDYRISEHDRDPSVLLPSYAYVIKGKALQRRGRRGDLPIALQNYVKAIDALSGEGTSTQWWKVTIKDTLEGVVKLYNSGIDINPALEAAGKSGILPLVGQFNSGEIPQQLLLELMHTMTEWETETSQSSTEEHAQ